MLDDRVAAGLNQQFNAEFAASQRYLEYAAFAHSAQLPGFAAWFQGRAGSARANAYHYLQYIVSRGGRAVVEGLDGFSAAGSTIEEVMRDVLAFEESRSASAEALHDIAITSNDKPTQVVLEKFVIGSSPARIRGIRKIINALEMAGTSGPGLIMVDRSLAG